MEEALPDQTLFYQVSRPRLARAVASLFAADELALSLPPLLAIPDTATAHPQLYMNRDASISLSDLRAIVALGYRAIILTVDTPIPGNRELDLRTGLDPETIAAQGGGNKQGKKGVFAMAATASTIACDVTWDIIAWIREVTGLPVIVKGVQTVQDALLAVEHGAQGLMLSNHGSVKPFPSTQALSNRAPEADVSLVLRTAAGKCQRPRRLSRSSSRFASTPPSSSPRTAGSTSSWTGVYDGGRTW